MRVPAFVCLCLLARLLKNAWMGLDEILLVDIAHERNEPDPDHSLDPGTGFF